MVQEHPLSASMGSLGKGWTKRSGELGTVSQVSAYSKELPWELLLGLNGNSLEALEQWAVMQWLGNSSSWSLLIIKQLG